MNMGPNPASNTDTQYFLNMAWTKSGREKDWRSRKASPEQG
jgi:hypothetical protein